VFPSRLAVVRFDSGAVSKVEGIKDFESAALKTIGLPVEDLKRQARAKIL
jgi:hypothetical protein